MTNPNVFVGRVVLVLGIFFCQTLLSFASNLDSLLQVAEGLKPGLAQAESYSILAQESSDRALYAEALSHCEKALALQKKFGSALGQAQAMVHIGVAFGNLNDREKSIFWIEKGLKVYRSQRDEAGVAAASTEMGRMLIAGGGAFDRDGPPEDDYLLAKEYLLDALAYHHEHDDKEMLVKSYYALGGIAYSFENSPAKTLRNYYKVIELLRDQLQSSSAKDNLLAGAYNNSGLIYLYGKEDALAIEYMIKALESLPEDGNERFRGVIHTNLAYLHRRTKEYGIAHHHLNVLLDIGTALDNSGFIQRVYDWRASFYLDESRLDSARFWVDVAKDFGAENDSNGAGGYRNYTLLGDLSFAENDYSQAKVYYDLALDNNGDDLEALSGASKCAKLAGDFLEALEFREMHQIVQDSLRELRQIPAISLSETREEMNLKEKEDRRRVERDLKEARERNFLQYSAGLLLIAILLLLLNLVVKFTLPTLFIKGASFITVLTLFEFALVYLDPTIEEISAGEPLTKLGINLLIAVVIFPLHTFIEKRIAKTNGRAE